MKHLSLMTLACVLFVAAHPCPCPALPADEQQSQDSQRAAPPDVSKMDPKDAQTLIETMLLQRERDAKRIQELEARLAQCEAQAAKPSASQSKAKPTQQSPSPAASAPAPAAAPVTVTAKQLELVGERYVGKRVLLKDWNFSECTNASVGRLHGLTITTDGFSGTIGKNELDRWMGVHLIDSDRHAFRLAFALKDVFGDLLLSAKTGQKMTLEGVAVRLGDSASVAVVVDKVAIAENQGSPKP